MFRYFAAALSGWLLLAPATSRAAVCSRADIAQAAAAIMPARAALTAFPIVDDADVSIPPPARSAISRMKTRLAALTEAYMRCAPLDIDPRVAQRELSALMGAGTPKTIDHYGQGIGIVVQRPDAHRMILQPGFAIKCANDDVTLVYAVENGQWRERLLIRNDGYKDPAGATDGLTVKLSAAESDGTWFAVATTVAPWCSSNWTDIRYAVYRPSGDPLKPHKLFGGNASFYRNDDTGKLTVGMRDFDLRFTAESIDSGLFSREWVRHYSVIGDTVRRIPPFADTPRDLVEEWIQSPWSDAQLWTLPASHLQAIHDKLHAKPYAEMLAVRVCRLGGWQVQIHHEEYDSDYFLTVDPAEGTNFTITDVSTSRNSHCAGKNLYDPNKPG
ncbi:MAG TPA: hypothetical protein VGG48_07700 [Rhizomicrobium sp.]|jgi:hypothetical protein